MSQSNAAFISSTLARFDTEYIFGVPSESLTELMDALYDEPRLTFVPARHEGGAAFMAEAYAAAHGGVGVVLAGRAVGAANLSIGVHTARENSTPLLVLIGQVSSRHRGREGFQETDIDRFLRPVAKASFEEPDPRRVPGVVRRCLTLATGGRPGPVVLSLPEDVLAGTTDSIPPTSLAPYRPAPSEDEVVRMLDALKLAERPVIVAGAGVLRSDAREELRTFAHVVQTPVLAGWRRHDVLSNDDDLYAGHLQMGTHPAIVETLSQADLVLAVGARLNEITTQGYSAIDEGTRIVQVDIDSDIIGRSHHVDIGVVADAREALSALSQAASQSQGRSWAVERRAAYIEATGVEAAPNHERVDNRQVVGTLREALGPDGVITNDAGNFSGWLHTYYRFSTPGSYVGAASGAMGYALPAAIGVKLAHPQRRVVAVAGDGGFMMTVQELETAVRLGTPVVCLVFNNFMLGSIRMHQERAHPRHVIGTDLGNPDFVRLAESFGALGFRVDSDAELPKILQEALEAEAPSVIELRTDPEQISVWKTIEELRGES